MNDRPLPLTRIRLRDTHGIVLALIVAAMWSDSWISIGRSAEPTTTPSAQSPLTYRRVYVPADNINAWPRESEKFIPVEAREFEALVSKANDTTTNNASAANIESAEYLGHLDANGRLVGTGTWKIAARGDKPSLLPLGEMSLVIQDARWQSADSEPARLGYWAESGDEAKRLGLEVSRSDALNFKWGVPIRPAGESIEIPWRLPPTPTSRLTLELPEGKTPSIEGGVILESVAIAPDISDGKPRRRWTLALPTGTNTVLRLASSGQQATSTSRDLALQENCSYKVEQNGLRIAASWWLDGVLDRERELRIPLPRGAQLESIQSDGEELEWQIVRGSTSPTDVATVKLAFPSGQRSLQLAVTAWSPLILDRPWLLPIIRPDGVFWNSGKFDLAIADTFELKTLTPIDCAQTHVSQPGPSERGVETHSLQLFSPSATLELAITKRKPNVVVRTGSSLILSDPDVTGRLVAEWDVARSSVHRLSGEIAAGWNIETVEAVPADAMAEWFVERRGKSQHIEIQLTEAASPARKVTISLMGRLQRFSLSEPIPADTLRMVQWASGREIQHLLTFQSTEPFAVESVGDLPTLPRESITDADRALLDGVVDEAQIVDLTHAGPNAGLQLTFKRGQYSAGVELDATLAKNELRQIYRITAKPKANPVDRLLVFATSPLGSSTRWTKGDLTLIANRLPFNDQEHKDLPKHGELWQVRLPQATTGAIEIHAIVSTPTTKKLEVPLVALPEATEQQGRVLVRGINGNAPVIELTDLTPTPLPSQETGATRSEEPTAIRAAYRFKPVDCLTTTKTPRLWIGPAAESVPNPLVARSLDLESFYWPDGRGIHRATYELENFGAAEFKPSLAPSATIASITVDGRAIESLSASAADSNQASSVRISTQSRATTVAVYFLTQQASLQTGRAIAPPIEQKGTPILAGQWTIWLPEEFSVQNGSPSADASMNWRKRLFGPLARSQGVPAFQPLHASDWARLVNGMADWWSSTTAPPVESQPLEPGPTTATPPGSPSSLVAALGEIAKQKASPIPLAGWQAFHQSFVADGIPEAITVLHPARTSAWTIAIFLACLLLGYSLGRSRAQATFVLIGIAAGATLLLPAAFSPLAAGAFWGLVGAAIINLGRHSSRLNIPFTIGRGRAVVAGLILLLILGLAKRSIADPQTPNQAVTAPAIERVLIPVDANRQPSDTKYYLSERFLRELLSSPGPASTTGNQWLLRGATYTGELSENRGRADIAAGTWSLEFSVETLARDTTIALPLAQDEATWQPTAMLDGVPTPINWEMNGRRCVVKVDQPGVYTLTLYCVPKTETVNARSQFSLTIPRLTSASIRLRAPELLSGVVVENATLAAPTKDSPGNLDGELTLADRLAVNWPRLESKASANQGLTVTELNWLDVGEAGIELQTKYVMEGTARRPEKLSISHHPDWQLIPEDGSTKMKRPQSESTGPRTVDVPLPVSAIDRQEVLLRWKLKDPAVAGNFRLPSIELASIPATQRWFAISADPSLECALLDSTALEATSKEFLTKWGSTNSDAPQIVLPNADVIGNCSFSVRPRDVEPMVREVLHIAASGDTMRVVYQANISPGNQYRFQYRVAAPLGLSIEGITLNSGDQRIPTRWTTDTDGHINVFFASEAATDVRLTISGTLPISPGSKTTLPRIVSAANGTATQQVQVYREDDVNVQLLGLPPAEESSSGPNDLPPVQWLVRPLGVYHLDGISAKAASIQVEQSEPVLKGDSLTTLSRESDAWWAAYRCQLTVEDGEVDTLRFRVPSNWTGPFNVESSTPATTSVEPVDDESSVLTVRFSSAIPPGGAIDLRVRGPLAYSSGVPVHVPSVVLTGHATGRNYLLVPDTLDSKRIVWNESEVRAGEIPKKLLPSSVKNESQRQLEILKRPFQVSIRTETAAHASPRIRVADTVISTGDRGSQLIATRFIVTSDGLPQCILQLPLDQQLVSITLDGHPALASPAGPSQWNVALGAAQLPQSLEVVGRSSADAAGDSRSEANRAVLLAGKNPIPVDLSLWMFARPKQTPLSKVEQASTVSAVDQATLRFDRLVSIADSAVVASADAPAPDGENWSKPWAAMLIGAKGQAERALAQQTTPTTVAQVSRSSEELFSRTVQRLEEWLRQTGNTAAVSTTGPTAIGTTTLAGLLPLGNDQEVTCYLAESNADRLTLKTVSPPASEVQLKVLGLLLIAAVASTGAYLIRLPMAADFLYRWASVLGIVVGIAYWAWLWPSWLGLVISAVSVWLGLRFNWPGRSVRPEASTVLRSTRLG